MLKIKTREEFEAQLASAITQTREALDAANRGDEMPGLSGQYEVLLEYLEEVQSDVRAGTIPDENERHRRSVGRMLIDGWDTQDPLGELILHIIHYYLNRI